MKQTLLGAVVLLCALLPIQGKANVDIFTDRLMFPWQTSAWGPAVDLGYRGSARSGSVAVRIKYFNQWEGLQFSNIIGVSTASEAVLGLSVRDDISMPGLRELDVLLFRPDLTRLGFVHLRDYLPANLIPGMWYDLQIPLQALGADNAIVGHILVQNTSAAVQPRVYLDDLRITHWGGVGFLRFPLQGTLPKGYGYKLEGALLSPYTTRVVSILDNDLKQNGIVVAYDGEKGSAAGCNYSAGVVGYKKADGTPFSLQLLNYDEEVPVPGAKNYLFYDNHRGYDYAFKGIDKSIIHAAAYGILCVATSQIWWDGQKLWRDDSQCPAVGGSAASSWGDYHTFYILHPNGYSTWYLHAENLKPDIYAEIVNNGYAEVFADQEVAFVGSTGAGSRKHLHFAVRDENEKLVDPYGDGSLGNPLILWQMRPPQ